jgi:orotate phosphoribosyltransferase
VAEPAHMIHVRPATTEDAAAWLTMRHALWPDEAGSHAEEVTKFLAGKLTHPREVLVAFDEAGAALGFVELSIRSYVDGCDTDWVGYLEGWYVVPDHRRRGVGRALVAAAEEWARRQGSTEFGSDALLQNDVSAAAHRALGFEETEQLRYFRKVLDTVPVSAHEIAAEDFLKLVSGRPGHFQLESGYHGGLWLDLDALFAEPRRIDPFVAVLTAALRPYRVDLVCGALLGGAFLAQLVARSLLVEFCFTERVLSASTRGLYQATYRLPDAFAARVRGKRIAMVDDVMSAGSALHGTYAALRAHAAVPVVAGALLVLGTKGAAFFAEHGVPVEAAARHEYEMWTPAECPHCLAGVPLTSYLSNS